MGSPPASRRRRSMRGHRAAGHAADGRHQQELPLLPVRRRAAPPPALARWPANSAAPQASRYVSRARRTSSGSSLFAARRSRSGALPPRRCAKTISARSSSMRACPSSSSGPASAIARSRCAASKAPAPRLACAASSALLSSPFQFAGQCDRALEERSRSSLAAASLGAAGGQLELVCHRLVGPGGRGSQMPCPTIRIEMRVGDLRERQVGRPSLRGVGEPVDGRAGQWVQERDALVHHQQSVGCVDRRRRDLELRAGVSQEQRIADGLRRGEEQQLSGGLRERRDPAGVALLDLTRQVVRVRDPEPTGQLRRRPAPGQLDQRQGIAVCLGENSVSDPLVERERHCRVQERSGVAVDEAAHFEFRHVLQVLAALPGSRTRAPPARPGSAERRRRASGPMPDPATGHRRPRRAADVALPLRASSVNAARPTRNRSGASPSVSPNAIRNASRCGSGSRSTPPSSGAHSWCSPAYANSISDSTPVARTTLMAAADSTRYCSSAVLPIPASPVRTSERLSPRRTDETNSSSRAHSCSRPQRRVLRAGRSRGHRGTLERSPKPCDLRTETPDHQEGTRCHIS